MNPVIRDHALSVILDDETWAALEAKAQARGESPAEVTAYAIELFLEREGFTPQWALAPLDARFAKPSRSSGSRRRAR